MGEEITKKTEKDHALPKMHRKLIPALSNPCECDRTLFHEGPERVLG